jgi:hypothetical protein
VGEWVAWAEGLMAGLGSKRKDNAETQRALSSAEKRNWGRDVGAEEPPSQKAQRVGHPSVGRAAVHAGIIDA